MTKKPEHEPEAFAEAVATLPTEDVRRMIADSVRDVDRYNQLETGSEARLNLVLEMSERLAPLTFPSRLEPRTAIASAWRDATNFAEGRFFEAVGALLQQEDGEWGARQVSALLELLAEAGLAVPSAVVFLAQRRLKADFDRWGGVVPLSSLMALVPNDATAIFSMLDRLKSDGMLAPSAVQSGVRKVCKWEPESLERSLALFGPQLFDDEDEMEAVHFFLSDLIERAGTSPVVLAITGIDPDLSPKLIAAAFGGDKSPFGLMIEFEGEESDLASGTFVTEGSRVLSLNQLGAAASEPEWTLKVRLASSAQLLVTVADSNPTDGVDFDGLYGELVDADDGGIDDEVAATFGDHSFASLFAQRMHLKVLT